MTVKGSWDRTKDRKAAAASWDRIFKKKEPKKQDKSHAATPIQRD